jgi:GNAT superfamily N-acetyltransferase
MSEQHSSLVSIRRAQPADLAELTRLCAQLGYPTETSVFSRRFETIREDENQAVFAAVLTDGRVIGWLHVLTTMYLESDAFAEIGGIVVDELHRRSGAGKALMHAAEEWAKEQGLRAVRLRSNVVRKKAHLFYRSIGYQQVKAQYTFEKELT